MNSGFDRYAKNYDRILDKSVRISGEEARFFAEVKIQLMCEQIRRFQLTAKKILDFGSGTGNGFQYVRKYFPDAAYYGVDPSKASVVAAKRKWGYPHFYDFDKDRLPFQNDDFDIAFASVVFHHIPFERHGETLEEIYRVLKLGAGFFLFEHNPYNPIVRKVVNDCPFDKDAVLLTPRYSKRLFRQSAFRICHLKYYLFFPRFLKAARFLERYLSFVPLGGQYYVHAQKKE
jgi:ubiquinone/menaquinone biosynthesis C-methylase UbiE